jgi:hypothetical protein
MGLLMHAVSFLPSRLSTFQSLVRIWTFKFARALILPSSFFGFEQILALSSSMLLIKFNQIKYLRLLCPLDI